MTEQFNSTMNVKDSNTVKYPEHLNPFHSRSGGISKSFRGFFRATIRSFRGKDKEKPVIRPKPVGQQSPQQQSPQQHYLEPPIAFPRSRFSERVSKTETLRETSHTRQSLPHQLGKNPFDDGEGKKTEVNHLLPPKPALRTKLRRKKKKAPIPPDSMVDGYLSGSVNGSKWSLTSTESDMSSMYYSESEIERRLKEHQLIASPDEDVKTEEILKITREIAQFTEDTNNNILNKEHPDKTEEVSPENARNKVLNPENSEIKELNPENSKIKELNPEISKIKELNSENSQNKELNPENSKNKELNPENSQTEMKQNDKTIEIPTLQIEIAEVENDTEKTNNNMPDVIKTTANDQPSDVNQNSLKTEEDKDVIELTKIQDELEEIEKRLTDSEYIIENRNSVKQAIEFFEYSRQTMDSPTPKVRKNILTKEKLLGSELD